MSGPPEAQPGHVSASAPELLGHTVDVVVVRWEVALGDSRAGPLALRVRPGWPPSPTARSTCS